MPFAELTDVRCYYELLGSGEAILLIPGLGTTCTLWDCIVNELGDRFSLIMPDCRCVGRSIQKRAPQMLSDFAVDLLELLDHLQLDRAHVMGLSLGGIIAQQFAIDHPSRVDRLVLISCTNRFGPYLSEMASLIGHALRYFPPDVFQRTVGLLGTAPEYLDSHPEMIDEKITSAREMGVARSGIARQLRCLICSDIADKQTYRITAPTLVIAGDQDFLIPACYAKKMADQIPGSEFVLIPGCGHNPLTEMPEEVVPRIRDFLSRSRHEKQHHKFQLSLEETV
jgi:3-oxoadipate enol-lactonase